MNMLTDSLKPSRLVLADKQPYMNMLASLSLSVPVGDKVGAFSLWEKLCATTEPSVDIELTDVEYAFVVGIDLALKLMKAPLVIRDN